MRFPKHSVVASIRLTHPHLLQDHNWNTFWKFNSSPSTNASDRKAEADCLLQQRVQQHETSQFQEVLQSYQQALEIYREIGNRVMEGRTLNNIGAAYRSLGVH